MHMMWGDVMGRCWVVMVVALWRPVGGRYTGQWVEGEGDDEFVQLLDIARGLWATPPDLQSVGMLYLPEENRLMEGPTWRAWWTQNSYGPTFASAPFLPEPIRSFVFNGNHMWFDKMADGNHIHDNMDWIPADGTLCDCANTKDCVYRQGDGNPWIHDETLEETLSALVMQGEMLLVTRDTANISYHLPLFAHGCHAYLFPDSDVVWAAPGRTCHLFQSGPASNLLAPSYAGWGLDNGRFEHAFMTGLTVTYSAALQRMIELETMAPRPYPQITGTRQLSSWADLHRQRLSWNLESLVELLAPTGDYFVRYLDPNGTVHGVLGQERYGYFESSPNHDAVCFGVVDDKLAERIYAKFEALNKNLRPHGLIIPNWPGYDDMYTYYNTRNISNWLWSYGAWVNGGHWTTTEARFIIGALRVGRHQWASESMNAMLRFGRAFKMDNPLRDFGANVTQGDNAINLTIDAFGSAAGLLRGIFQYAYSALSLVLRPRLPPSITSLRQHFPVYWGKLSLFVGTVGRASEQIACVTVGGQMWSNHTWDAVTLNYEKLLELAPSNGSLDVDIHFGVCLKGSPPPRRTQAVPSVTGNSSFGFPELRIDADAAVWRTNLSAFAAGMVKGGFGSTVYETAHAELALAYYSTVEQRCDLLKKGSLKPLPTAKSQDAADVSYSNSSRSLSIGLYQVLSSYAGSSDERQRRVYAIWTEDGEK